jgi:peptidyl-prolyl cis-trans isomerase SurA
MPARPAGGSGMTVLKRLLRAALAAAALAALLLAGGRAEAQDLQKIAAVVNDDVITYYDLLARVNLIVSTSNLPNTPDTIKTLAPQVLQSLINERLQLQEAQKVGVEVGQKDLDSAVATIERLNQMPEGAFLSFLKDRGLDADSALDQIRAQVAWAKVVRSRYGAAISISPDDVQAEVARRKAEQGKPLYHLAEIFLPVESSANEEGVRADAENLIAQLRAGASFSELARQFSQNASAAVGGDLGWVRPSQLAREVADAIVGMAPGSVAGPIRTVEGYQIMALVERTVSGESASGDETVHLAQLILPLAQDASAEAVETERLRAQNIAETTTSCARLVELAQRMAAPMSGDLGEMGLRDLPEDIRNAVASLPVDKASAPVRSPNGWHVLMVCERKGSTESDVLDPDRVRDELYQGRLDQAARRYLRDLHRLAFIDIRL